MKEKLSEACNSIKKEALTQMFFCEFCEISENTFFTDHFRATASGKRTLFVPQHINRVLM